MMTAEAAHMLLEHSQNLLSSSTNLPVISLFELPVCIFISDRNDHNYPLPILKHYFLKARC